ncbi:NACHT and WD repeat domain-containing protein [Nocardia sp. NPDC059240]|uniref:NACHT and WD repeat domain-containing protein n=1 Tax=Nocardia sp. NPDC059240 TaxID=3346786 RepID=UPI0036A66206
MVFAQRFSALYEAAGNPKLRQVEAAARARMAAAAPRGTIAPVQRISDWRIGRNVPAKFDYFLPILLTLIDEARKSSTPVPQLLLSVPAWERLWRLADGWNPDDAAAPSPYLGLESFHRDDTAVFFGRSRPTEELVRLVHAASDPGGDGGLVIVVGASGAGKSSLLAAGVAPALVEDPDAWVVAGLTPGPDPHAALIAATDDTGGEVWGADAPRLLIVDQLEELFTLGSDEQQREDFLTALQQLALPRLSQPSIVIVAVRADFYGRCLDHPILEEALKHRSYLLGPMRLNELAEAVTRPAELAGYRLESGLEELVISELCGHGARAGRSYDPGSLPLLSHVMRATWERRVNGRLTMEGYHAAGGVMGSVAATAERAWTQLSPLQQAMGRQLLLGLITIGQDTRDTRRRVSRQELLGSACDEATLEVLTSTRLITVDSDAAYLTHEVVLDAWPRLRAWIDQDRVGFLQRQRLHADATEWIHADRDTSRLYRGARLASLEGHTTEDSMLSAAAGEFLTASRQARARGQRRSRAVKLGFAVLTVVVVVLAAVAFAQRDSMAVQRQAAIVAAVLANADRLQTSDPSLSAALDVVADRLRPNDIEIRARLLATQDLPLATPIRGETSQRSPSSLAFRPDGQVMVSYADHNRIRLWDVEDPTRPYELASVALAADSYISQLSFTGDGNTLIVLDRYLGLRLWDVHDPRHPSATGAQIEASSASTLAGYEFSVHGSLIALAADDSTMQLWDIANPDVPVQVTALPDPDRSRVSTIVFNPAGTLLAIVRADERDVQLWDTTTPATPTRTGTWALSGSDDSLELAFSPDGHLLAAGGFGPMVWLWNIDDPRNPHQLSTIQTEHTSTFMSMGFAPDSSVLFTASADSTVKLWALETPTRPQQWRSPLQTAAHDSAYALFSPAGHTLVTIDRDGTVNLWSLPKRPIQRGAGSISITFSGNGTLMATGDTVTGQIQLWATREPQNPRLLAHLDHAPATGNLTMSPDGHTLVARIRAASPSTTSATRPSSGL